MRILQHVTANDEQLDRFDFKRELSMEAYLVENEGILSLDENFSDVEIVAEELTLKQGRKSKETDGRIDVLVTYAQEYIGVVELKLGQLGQIHLEQLEDYLLERDRILEEYPDILPIELAPSPKWIGVLVGNSIDESLAQKLSRGYSTPVGNIPIAALTIQRFRSRKKGTVYVVTDTHFKNVGATKDTTKYVFNGKSFGKGRLVLEIIKTVVAKNPSLTFSELTTMFPKSCQGSIGVFTTADEANLIYQNSGHRRHYLKPDELVEVSNETIAVSNQWGVTNIDGVISRAKGLGYTIEKS